MITSNLTAREITDVSNRLEDILHSMRAIHEFADHTEDGKQVEHFHNAIREMARSNIRGLDACIKKLSGRFSGEFESELACDSIGA
jgi:hypothetical protein